MDLEAFRRRFGKDDACREQLERTWWPDGPVCHHCGAVGRVGRINGRPGVYTCHDCLKQITVTRGTPLHGSRLPLTIWFEAMYRLAVYPHTSAKRLGEKLGVPYSTAWTLYRRIRTLIDDGRFPLQEYLVLDVGKVGKQPSETSVSGQPVPELSYGPKSHDHLIIEGDERLALRWLRERHRGRVQCILTAPPYGQADGGLYQDRFSKTDWLRLLRDRLLVARDLLSDDGVVLVSTDDAHRAGLDLLLEETFVGYRRMGALPWRPWRRGRKRNPFAEHEYVLAYACPGFRPTHAHSLDGLDLGEPMKMAVLFQSLVSAFSKAGGIVLDPFAWSAATAQAVLEANAIDEGGHRFMLLRETAKAGQDPVLADVHHLIERFNRRRSMSPTSLMYSRILVEDE